MQDFNNPAARNQSRAAGGTLPGKVSVPFPEKANKPQGGNGTGGKAKAPAGFNNGLINGKV